MRSSATAAISIVILTIAAGVALGAASTSGLRGTVSITPAAALCRDDDCTKPAVNLTILFTRAGAPTKRALTDATGHYRVLLPPGRYTVSAARTGPTTRITPTTARVPRDHISRVDILIDTGRQ